MMRSRDPMAPGSGAGSGLVVGKPSLPSSSSSYAVPPSIAWLEQLTFQHRVTRDRDRGNGARVRYVLEVTHARSPHVTSWAQARGFREYRQFRRRLLQALAHGHFCHAECPWLYTFLKSYFPKSCLLGQYTTTVIDRRREQLQQYLTGLQTFLIAKRNHACPVITTAVANVVVEFINGPEGHRQQQCWAATIAGGPPEPSTCTSNSSSTNVSGCGECTDASTCGHLRRSWGSCEDVEELLDRSGIDDGESDEARKDDDDDDGACAICGASLAGPARSAPVDGMVPVTREDTRATVHSSIDACSVGGHDPSPHHLTEFRSGPLPESLKAATVAASHAREGSGSVMPAIPASPTGQSSVRPLPRLGSQRGRRPSWSFHYTTALRCGHQFHDECIVPKLNEAMQCPTCGAKEG